MFDNGHILGAHTISCKRNPSLNKIRENQNKKRKGRVQSSETKFKISIAMQKAVAEGRQKTLKPGGICRCFKVKNHLEQLQNIQGSWELKVVEFFNEKKIKWCRNHTAFDYVYEDKNRKYFPDFYLEDFDVFVEVKGYETDKDLAKWKMFPRKILIIKKDEIKDLEKWALSLKWT